MVFFKHSKDELVFLNQLPPSSCLFRLTGAIHFKIFATLKAVSLFAQEWKRKTQQQERNGKSPSGVARL